MTTPDLWGSDEAWSLFLRAALAREDDIRMARLKADSGSPSATPPPRRVKVEDNPCPDCLANGGCDCLAEQRRWMPGTKIQD